MYGKWTEFIKVCSSAAHEQWAKEKGDESSSQTPSHTPKKVLAKLNSFKVGALRSMSIQDVSIFGSYSNFIIKKSLVKNTKIQKHDSNCNINKIHNQHFTVITILYKIFQNDEPEGSDDIPKADESYNIDISGSVTLWEARPRPTNSAQVIRFLRPEKLECSCSNKLV